MTAATPRYSHKKHVNGEPRDRTRSSQAVVWDKSQINRSGVTNLKRFFVEPVHDTALKRRWQDLFRNITSDIGGYENLSEASRQLCRRAATLSLMAERIERVFILNKPFNSELIELYCAISQRLLSILGKLGTKRIPRSVNSEPANLKSYLRQRKRATIDIDGEGIEEAE